LPDLALTDWNDDGIAEWCLLVRRHVAVIAAIGGVNSALAAKAATSELPIVFLTGRDPVELGFVKSFNRPGGNLTGINLQNAELESKRLELLRELVPNASTIAILINPDNQNHRSRVNAMQAAVRARREVDRGRPRADYGGRTAGAAAKRMNKKYQVFISSTFATNLINESEIVIVEWQSQFMLHTRGGEKKERRARRCVIDHEHRHVGQHTAVEPVIRTEGFGLPTNQG
jgi:ABC transporter substrate binding protein